MPTESLLNRGAHSVGGYNYKGMLFRGVKHFERFLRGSTKRIESTSASIYPYLRRWEKKKKVVMRPNCLMLRGDRVFGRNRNYDMSNQKCRKTNNVEWFPMGRNIERGIGFFC